jgi:hypothetical protein
MRFELPHDPIILLGIINMNLRDFYPNMALLCEDLELDFESIDRQLKDAGFDYDHATNQYHPI